jgi:hypothetical protein
MYKTLEDVVNAMEHYRKTGEEPVYIQDCKDVDWSGFYPAVKPESGQLCTILVASDGIPHGTEWLDEDLNPTADEQKRFAVNFYCY